MVGGVVKHMKIFLFTLVSLIIFSFSGKAEYGMISGNANGLVFLFNTETGEVWSCGDRTCNRVAIDIEDIKKELKFKGYSKKPIRDEGVVFN